MGYVSPLFSTLTYHARDAWAALGAWNARDAWAALGAWDTRDA